MTKKIFFQFWHLTIIFSMCFVMAAFSVNAVHAADVGKWKRHELSYSNSSWDGNPFDVKFEAVFKHSTSGRTVRQLGFYAGSKTWKIFFMPDLLGEWTYVTESDDTSLNGKTGSLNCVVSALPGRLSGDNNRWQLEENNEYVAPIMIPTRQWFKRTNTSNGVDDFINWAEDTVGALIIGTTLVYFSHSQSEVPYIKGKEGVEFNIPMWDRLNSHYDRLRDKGMGHYIMFYSDDAESPNRHNIKALSTEELRLFRYTVARFSAYPIVMWDTGIDINETRSLDWMDWFADWFNSNDPWQHPVSSRHGGNSGRKLPNNASYNSLGDSTLPSHSTAVNNWRNHPLAIAYTDRWREDYSRGGFNKDKIRRAAWEIGLVGGGAVYVSGNENGGYLTESYASDLKAAPYLGHRNRFFRQRISNLGNLEPHADLVKSGSGIVLAANPGQEYIAYDYNGGEIGLDLSDVVQDINYEWYNPRAGTVVGQGTVNAGSNVKFTAPFSGDAVLYVTAQENGGSGNNKPVPPTELEISIEPEAIQ